MKQITNSHLIIHFFLNMNLLSSSFLDPRYKLIIMQEYQNEF